MARLHRAEGKIVNESLSADAHVQESFLLFSVWGLLHYCKEHCLSLCLSTGAEWFLDGLPWCRREKNRSGVVESGNGDMRRTGCECSNCKSIVGSCVSVFSCFAFAVHGRAGRRAGSRPPLPLFPLPLSHFFPSRTILFPFRSTASFSLLARRVICPAYLFIVRDRCRRRFPTRST